MAVLDDCRVYPPGFGARLLELYKTAHHKEVRCDLRKVFAVSPDLSDRENFEAYPVGDLWDDADLFAVFVYLKNYRGLRIPDSWGKTMDDFFMECRIVPIDLSDTHQNMSDWILIAVLLIFGELFLVVRMISTRSLNSQAQHCPGKRSQKTGVAVAKQSHHLWKGKCIRSCCTVTNRC